MENPELLVGMVLIAIGAFWGGLILGVSVGESWAHATKDDDEDSL